LGKELPSSLKERRFETADGLGCRRAVTQRRLSPRREFERRDMSRSSKHRSGGRRALFPIAIFKWVKGAILLAVAAGAVSLFHKDVQSNVEHWISACRIIRTIATSPPRCRN
jgi:hypothetical protein